MNVVCLDLEGVLVPEIWIELAETTGIEELKRTTRDEPDYDKLMNYRLDILKEHGLGIREIQDVISTMDPMPGAKEFLDELRAITQVIIVSDTFTQFAKPLIDKLGLPTIFCNDLVIDDATGHITGYKMRCENTKFTTVKALHEAGIDTIASGDSYNDLGMIENSKAGFFFRTTDALRSQYPDIPAYEEYSDLLEAPPNSSSQASTICTYEKAEASFSTNLFSSEGPSFVKSTTKFERNIPPSRR